MMKTMFMAFRKKRIQDVEKLLVKNDSGKWMAFSDDEKKEVLINILCVRLSHVYHQLASHRYIYIKQVVHSYCSC